MKNRHQKQFIKGCQRNRPYLQNDRFVNDRYQYASANPDNRRQSNAQHAEGNYQRPPEQDYENFDDFQSPSRSRDDYNQAGSNRDRGYTAGDYGNEWRENDGSYGGGRRWYPSRSPQTERERVYDRYGNEFSRRPQSGNRFAQNRSGEDYGLSNRDYGGGYDIEMDDNLNVADQFERPLGLSADIGLGGGRQQYSSHEDREQRGRYSGIGPKGFKRSDENLKEQVCERLEFHGELDASEITVDVDDCVVTLSGCVADRRQKRIAEDCAESVRGINDVHNNLTVNRAGASSKSGDDQARLKGQNPSRRYKSNQKSDSDDAMMTNG